MTVKFKKATAPEIPPAPGSSDTSPAPETRVRPLVAPRAPSSAKNKTRILLQVLDGKIEWEKMDAAARKQFQDLFQDREFLAQFGLTGREKLFDPAQVKYLYDAISTLYRTVVGIFLRWPEPALKLLAYTPEQKETLAEPTANLANRFAPAFLQKHQELIVWGAIFGAITQQNFQAATAKANELMQKPAPAPGPPGPRAVVAIPAPTPTAPASRPAPVVEVPFMPPPSMVGGEIESLEM